VQMILGVSLFRYLPGFKSTSLSSRSYTRICTEGHKGHEDGSGIGFRHDLGYLSLLFESFFDVRNSL
jgi:hypothetical protein